MAETKRTQMLLEMLQGRDAVSVKELSSRLFVSEASVRRDIAQLEKAGAVRRLYGGVQLVTHEKSVVPLLMRDGEHAAIKDQLAKRAAAMVRDGDVLMLDASSTVRRMMKYLSERKNLTIITNSERIIAQSGNGDARIYCTGGAYNRENQAFMGPAAEAFLRTMHADWLFFSSQGVSEAGEISDHSEAETALRRAMLERAKRRVCLMDGSKIGVSGTFRLCGRDEVDVFICDQRLPWAEKEEKRSN